MRAFVTFNFIWKIINFFQFLSEGSGKLVFIKNSLTAKRVKDLERKVSETTCIELTISKKKWCILFAYKPPKQNNVLFFQEISNSLNQVINKYENVLLVDDLYFSLPKPLQSFLGQKKRKL